VILVDYGRILMDADQTVDAAADGEAYDAAQQKMIPNLSLSSPALRYRAASQTHETRFPKCCEFSWRAMNA